MKKILTYAILAVLLVAAFSWFRAETRFTDQQVPPAALDVDFGMDEAGAVQRLAKALTYQTISHDDRSIFDAEAFLSFHDYLAASFPLVHQQLERQLIGDYSLLFHLPGSNPDLKPVLFMGHQDVVPVDQVTLGEWTHPPFDGVVADGKIWGRGALDNKFSVMGLLEAMEMLLANGVQSERSIYLAFGHDEEVGGPEGAAAVAEYFRSRHVEFEFVLDEGGLVTEGIIEGIDQPVAVIGVAEKGFMNLRLAVDDPGGHSSQPPDHTAVGVLSQAIVRIEDNLFPASLEPMFISMDVLGVHMPFATRALFANTWLFESLILREMLKNPGDAAGIRTTTAATMFSGSSKSNILPTRAEAVVNFRVMPGESSQSVKTYIENVVNDERVKISIEMANEPSPVSRIDSDSYRMIAATIRAMDDSIIVSPYMVRGGTDAKWFMSLSPHVYRFLMARGTSDMIKLAHGVNEHVSEENYLQGVRFFYLVLQQAGSADLQPE